MTPEQRAASICSEPHHSGAMVYRAPSEGEVVQQIREAQVEAFERAAEICLKTAKSLRRQQEESYRCHGAGDENENGHKLGARAASVEFLAREIRAEAKAHRDAAGARSSTWRPVDVESLLLRLVDVVWGEANEDQSVPSTDWALRMIQRAKGAPRE
jgi:hypothetical protein